MAGLTHLEVMRIVNRYIGVSGGYLGDFSYRTHADFYSKYCDLGINPYELGDGTTREKFIHILQTALPHDQAKIVRGVVERFPVGQHRSPETRNEALRKELLDIAKRLDAAGVDAPVPRITSEVVRRALSDAETLIRTQGATSGVDRVHTALHGYLIAVCDQSSIVHSSGLTVTGLLQLLRTHHPKLRSTGPREQNVTQVLRAIASILDAMNPVRNMASVAHPNPQLLGEPEAMLRIAASQIAVESLGRKTTDTWSFIRRRVT
jgi:hypothetical protein